MAARLRIRVPQSKPGLIVIIEHPCNAGEMRMILDDLISGVL